MLFSKDLHKDLLAFGHLGWADAEEIEDHESQAWKCDWLGTWTPSKVVWESLLLEQTADPVESGDACRVVAAHGLQVDSSLAISEDELSAKGATVS